MFAFEVHSWGLTLYSVSRISQETFEDKSFKIAKQGSAKIALEIINGTYFSNHAADKNYFVFVYK